jgi:hypothetical protein
VADVSQRPLAHHGGLRGLFRLDVAERAQIRGLGDTKAVRVKAALELGPCPAAFSSQRLVRLACTGDGRTGCISRRSCEGANTAIPPWELSKKNPWNRASATVARPMPLVG